jgi:hypothetical protein
MEVTGMSPLMEKSIEPNNTKLVEDMDRKVYGILA